jgi:hypothetical protein
MGRYYSGDIEGKFWFGVQASDDADFFGVEGIEPEQLIYYFEKSDLPEIRKGIKSCKTALGKHKEEMDEFFEINEAYNDEKLAKHLKVTVKDTRGLLEWYARLELGEKILKCVEDHGGCSFTAEC